MCCHSPYLRVCLLAIVIMFVGCSDGSPSGPDTVETPSLSQPAVLPTLVTHNDNGGDEGQDAIEQVTDPVADVDPAGVEDETGVEAPETVNIEFSEEDERDVLAIAIDAPSTEGLFAHFDENGTLVGLDADLIALITEQMEKSYRLLAVPYHEIPAAIADGTFDAAISAIPITDETKEQLDGTILTDPYLELGEVMLVQANDTAETFNDIPSRDTVAAINGRLQDDRVQLFDSIQSAVQAVSNGTVRAAVIDKYHAQYYAERYPLRLKIVDDTLSSRQYGIMLSEDNLPLLDAFNRAIAAVQADSESAALIETILIDKQPIVGGDISLIGTPDDRLVVGVTGKVGNLDPADTTFDPIAWEIKQNTMSGLLRYDENNALQPALAAELPTISDDGLEYRFTIREGLTFGDGTALTADAVRQSILRSASSSNIFINNYIADTDGDGVADGVRVEGDLELLIELDEPFSPFVSLLATPPFFVVNPTCDRGRFNPDPANNCDGIGPYQITQFDLNSVIRLQANAMWPLDEPMLPTAELRFFTASSTLRTALVDEQIDVAWHGLSPGDGRILDNNREIEAWAGANTFKSYLVFEHDSAPWNDRRVRVAASYALDRDALAAVFEGERTPLRSPVPDGVAYSETALPQFNLSLAVSLLANAGYSSLVPAKIDLWYLSDGRYSTREKEYAEAIEAQLEATDVFEVTLNSASWETFQPQMTACEYPLFLLGWPGATAMRYNDPMIWMSYFIYNASVLCSNYEDDEMDGLFEALLEATNEAERETLYGEIQALWADELPTLDLLQAGTSAWSQGPVSAVPIDALGIMHYDKVKK